MRRGVTLLQQPAGSEAEAEGADGLAAVAAPFIIGIAIFGAEIGALADPELRARPDPKAIEILAERQVAGASRNTVVIGGPEAGVGIAGPGVELDSAADPDAGAGADVELAPGRRAERIAGLREV